MIFLVSYCVIAFVTAVIFTVSMASASLIDAGDSDEWWIASLFGLCAGMVWPATLLVWGVVTLARRIYYASRENNVV